MTSRWRLALFVILFLGLTAAGIGWALRGSGVALGDLAVLGTLPVATLATLAALAIGLYLADMIRYRVLGHAIGEAVSWRAALDATIANFFFGWITPGAALGAPAAIVMLGRRGVSWEGATLIAFGKSATSTALLVMIAFVMLAAGLGPSLDAGVLAVFASGLGVLAAILLVPILGMVAPRFTLRRIDGLQAWLSRRRRLAGPRGRRIAERAIEGMRRMVDRLGHLRDGGSRMPLAILGVHLVYLSVFVAVAVVLARSFGAASLADAIGISTVYAAFSCVAPTPGGAGLSEAVAVSFYGGLVGAHDAVLVVLLFRALTFYLHIVVGIVYLGIVGGTREILERRARPPAC